MSQSLSAQVRHCFDTPGVLDAAVPSFVPRSSQVDMALAVAQAIEDKATLVVEAGTGTGKTFAYLIPALLSGERVLISTATKTLQDQLFGRDLPRLLRALALPLRLALLKGRSSYVCQYRLAQARQSHSLQDPKDLALLARIEHWALGTRSGDLAELASVNEQSRVIPLVTSTRDNCLGSHCPQAKTCHVNLARREALGADVLVINHHLFFADMGVRESGVAELLPQARVLIFDEAHQLNGIGIQFLGQQLSTAHVLDFARDLLATGVRLARGWVDWNGLSAALELAARQLRLCAQHVRTGSKLVWSDATPQDLQAEAWRDALQRCVDALQASAQGLAQVLDVAPDLVRLHERAQALQQRTAHFLQPRAADTVRWLDLGFQLRLVESPLDISSAMAQGFKLQAAAPEHPAEPAASSSRSWIFTSATLGDDPALRWFTQPCGLTDARILRVPSPFNYAEQAALYVPAELPRPNEAEHSEQLACWAAPRVLALGGRTLVLTTTLKALKTIAQSLRQQLQAQGIEVLEQGLATKRELIACFERQGHAGQGAVLVASASFWEGVDIPGAALRMVIVDKLPFPPPGDPLAQALSQRLEKQGLKPFSAYYLPEAAVALKQGAGRLIRSETDSGVLVIADTRLLSMGYGRQLLAALPPMRRLTRPEELDQVLETLTRASTTAPTLL